MKSSGWNFTQVYIVLKLLSINQKTKKYWSTFDRNIILSHLACRIYQLHSAFKNSGSPYTFDNNKMDSLISS